MGIKEFIKKEFILLFIIALGFALGLYMYPILPEKVPIHWNVYGQIDNYGSKIWLVLWVPLLNLGIYLMMLLIPFIDPKKKNYSLFEGSYKLLRNIIVLFFFAIYLFVLFASIGFVVKVEKVVPIIVAVMLTLIGNYMGTFKQNFFVGIKTPWTLSDSEIWNKTHRIGGRIWVLGGILMILSTLLLKSSINFAVFMSIILIMVFVPIVYSYVLYARKEKN